MARHISILIIICLSLMFGGRGAISYAGSGIDPVIMQKHIEKVKRKNPIKYRNMVQKAGGIIKDCRSCHKEIFKRKRGN